MTGGIIVVGGGGGFQSGLLEWGQDEYDTILTESQQVARAKFCFHWNNNQLTCTIEGFSLTDIDLCMLITNFHREEK